MKVGIYCRISKDKGGKDRSLGLQEQDGINFAIENNFEYEVFTEKEGTSGTLAIEERPVIFSLLNKIKSKEIGIVFMYDLSRIERSPEEKAVIYNIIKTNNAKVYTERDGHLDFSRPEINLYSNLMSAINFYQVQLTKVKVTETLAKNVSEGRVHSAPPYGYKSGENKKLIINLDTAKIIKKIFNLTIEGNGGATIAKILTNEGVPTPTNHVGGENLTYRTQNIKNKVTVVKSTLKWNPGTVTRLIKNPIYKGERKWNNEVHSVEPIVTPEIFEMAQSQIQLNKNNSSNNTRHNYLLKGKIICAICGSNYHGYTQSKRNISVYKCYSNRIINKDIACKNRRIATHIIEDLLWQRVIGNPLLLKVLKADFDFNNEANIHSTLTAQINNLTDQLNQIDSSRRTAISLCTKKIITEVDLEIQITGFTKEKIEIENQLQILQSQKSISENQNNIIDEVKQFQARLRQFENPDFNTKRKLVDIFIDNVKVGYNTTDKLTEVEINLKLNEEYFSLNEKLSIDLRHVTSVTHQPMFR